MSFPEPSVRKTLPSCSFAALSRFKRKTAERLNAANSAENSSLVAEHGTSWERSSGALQVYPYGTVREFPYHFRTELPYHETCIKAPISPARIVGKGFSSPSPKSRKT